MLRGHAAQVPHLHILLDLISHWRRARSPFFFRGEFISIVVMDVYLLLPSFVNSLNAFPLWKVPTLCALAVFANINHTKRHHFELLEDKQHRTCPSGQSSGAEFLSNAEAHRLLLRALLGLSDHVMLLLSGSVSSLQTGLCSLPTGALLMNSLT